MVNFYLHPESDCFFISSEELDYLEVDKLDFFKWSEYKAISEKTALMGFEEFLAETDALDCAKFIDLCKALQRNKRQPIALLYWQGYNEKTANILICTDSGNVYVNNIFNEYSEYWQNQIIDLILPYLCF